MEIIIPLPQNSSANTYKELMSYLKQFELAVHHAQKSIEHAEKDGVVLSEDSYICFEHPSLEHIEGEEYKGFTTNFYEELQHIELKINLA